MIASDRRIFIITTWSARVGVTALMNIVVSLDFFAFLSSNFEILFIFCFLMPTSAVLEFLNFVTIVVGLVEAPVGRQPASICDESDVTVKPEVH